MLFVTSLRAGFGNPDWKLSAPRHPRYRPPRDSKHFPNFAVKKNVVKIPPTHGQNYVIQSYLMKVD